MTPFSIYVHIPYCQAKCPYCDFNSYAASSWPEQRYVAALERELTAAAAGDPWQERTVETVFFGGGTPSLFAPAAIAGVLDAIRSSWAITPGAEVTLEANPGTVTEDKLAGFRAAGVNRISFGVQSFQPHHLTRLGRIHSGDDAVQAVRSARRAGFERINVDLIYALPEQTLDEWRADLERGCELSPAHVSAYNLTYEEGTAFHQWRAEGRLHTLAEEIEVAMFETARDTLARAGFHHYEISNYAQPAEECRHNLTYWRAGDYLGVGAGAHSHAGARGGREGQRWGNLRAPSRYLAAVEEKGNAIDQPEVIDERRARGEFAFLNLRCLAGFSDEAFRERFGSGFGEAFPHIAQLCREGLLEQDGQHWRLTGRGLLLADSVFATFL